MHRRNRTSPSGPTTSIELRVTQEVTGLGAQQITSTVVLLPEGTADLGDTVIVNPSEIDLPPGVFVAGARISTRDQMLLQIGNVSATAPLGPFTAILDVVILRV